MAVNLKSLKNDLVAKDFNYCDNFFELKSEKNIFDDSFSFNSYEALKDLNDFKTNNYSNLFLTKKQLNSDWLEYKSKNAGVIQLGLVTTLSFFTSRYDSELYPGAYLYFDKNYEFWDFNITQAPYTLTKNRPAENYINHVFYVEFIDETHCRISHNFGDLRFYLTVNEGLNVLFSIDDSPEASYFTYKLENNKLLLYKTVSSTTYQFNEEGVEEEIVNSSVYSLRAHPFEEGSDRTSLFLTTDLSEGDDAIIYLNNNILDFEFYLNSSWVSYNRSQYISKINERKSAFSLNNQILFHHEYNTDEGINFIPLKNQFSYKGESLRGSNMTISSVNYPDVDYRNYTSINSGIIQEKGNDNIILTFSFYDQTYKIKDGQDLEITISDEKDILGYNALWPYKQINIADTKFVKNGAFGSNTPYFADKVKCLQDNYSPESNILNNATYLCSWLYRKNEESDFIWLDRYYYPDKITKKKAISKAPNPDHFKESFNNVLEKYYTDEKFEVDRKLQEYSVVDKVSDLTFEPGKKYIYSRLSSDMVNNVIYSLSPYRISYAKNNKRASVNLKNQVKFNKENYLKIEPEYFNKTNKININYDMYIDPSKKMGIQLFGPDYSSGLTIQNRKDLAPFFYIADDKKIYLVNNNYEIRREFDMYGTYGDKIIRYILGNSFDDVIVLSTSYIYIMTYDLKLKSKISYMDILGIENIRVYNGREIFGLEYPYTNDSLELNLKTEEYTTKTKIEIDPFEEKVNVKAFFPKINSILLESREAMFDLTGSSNLTDTGSIPMVSGFVDILLEEEPVCYNNNIYFPYGQNILKLIFVPDNENDQFSLTDRETYACKIRTLKSDEYFLNYKRSSVDDYSTEVEESLDNGVAYVQNKVKQIYIDDKGNIYGLNFDKFAYDPDGETLYGLYAYEEEIARGGWFWIYNQPLSKIQSSVSSSKAIEFGSPNSIDKITFNKHGEMALVRNFNNINTNENSDNNKRLDIFDRSKKIIYTIDLSNYNDIISLDAYTYIDEYGDEHDMFRILVSTEYGAYPIEMIEYERNLGVVDKKYLNDWPLTLNKYFTELHNQASSLRYGDSNKLYFNLNLPSPYVYDQKATITWDLADKEKGWYNFNILVDLEEAKFEVRINDTILETIDYDTLSYFEPYRNANGTVFDSTYYFGILGKKYGKPFNTILTDDLFDPYAFNNSKIENISIFNKTLEYYEYQAMRLEGKQINDLILTLPCGARNAVEEIVRYFKYNMPASISNSVKINISGAKLNTRKDYNLFRTELYRALEDNLDSLVKIKEIDFV